jgi:hypothetical protein
MKNQCICVSASVILILTLLSATSFGQQDACIALIQHGIYTSHVTQTSTQTYQEFRSNFCSWYTQYRDSHSGGSADIKIPIVDIPIGLSGNMTYGEADAMKSAICSAASNQSANNQIFVDASRYIDPNGAAAFQACVIAQTGGLKIQSNINDDETSAVIAIAYQAPFGAGPATVQRVDVLGWKCPKPQNGGGDLTDLVGKRNQFTNNQYSIICQRDMLANPVFEGGQQIVARDATINIGTTAGSYIIHFRPKIYKDPLADTAKVLASYPKGTILPFAGHRENIPQGWHLCDGHDGTVNLVDFIPYGASTDAQVDGASRDQHEGKRQHDHTVPDTDVPFRGGNANVLQGDRGIVAQGNDTQHHIGRTGMADNLPPVTRVFFIQKIN